MKTSETGGEEGCEMQLRKNESQRTEKSKPALSMRGCIRCDEFWEELVLEKTTYSRMATLSGKGSERKQRITVKNGHAHDGYLTDERRVKLGEEIGERTQGSSGG